MSPFSSALFPELPQTLSSQRHPALPTVPSAGPVPCSPLRAPIPRAAKPCPRESLCPAWLRLARPRGSFLAAGQEAEPGLAVPGWCQHRRWGSSGARESPGQPLGQEAEPRRHPPALGLSRGRRRHWMQPWPRTALLWAAAEAGQELPVLGPPVRGQGPASALRPRGSAAADSCLSWPAPSCTISPCNYPAGTLPLPPPGPQQRLPWATLSLALMATGISSASAQGKAAPVGPCLLSTLQPCTGQQSRAPSAPGHCQGAQGHRGQRALCWA